MYEEHPLITNIVRSKKQGVSEPWILATNGAFKWAIKDYGYRFGGIETIFKNQKSNGFYLEDVVNASLLYYENLYSTLCIATVLLTCIGVDYAENTKCYKTVNLETHKKKNNTKIRIISIFKTGLLLFKMAFNSSKYIRLPLHFILYDM